MSTNGENASEDVYIQDCEGEKVVTMMDVLKEQQEFEEDANAVLGGSDDKNCTYPNGYIKRQAIYACMTCCEDAKLDPTKRAGVCLACSLNCHENHELIELYTKRNFRCDCGNPKFNSHPCQFAPNKTDLNEDNIYNQNFSGLYCNCHKPYPDPEISDDEEMIQCIICEDWWHASHLDAAIPANDQYSEMICKLCMDKNEFLHDYSDFAVNVENVDETTMETSNLSITNVTSICNDSLELGTINGSATEAANENKCLKDIEENGINKEEMSEGVNENEMLKDTKESDINDEEVSDISTKKDEATTENEETQNLLDNNRSDDTIVIKEQPNISAETNEEKDDSLEENDDTNVIKEQPAISAETNGEKGDSLEENDDTNVIKEQPDIRAETNGEKGDSLEENDDTNVTNEQHDISSETNEEKKYSLGENNKTDATNSVENSSSAASEVTKIPEEHPESQEVNMEESTPKDILEQIANVVESTNLEENKKDNDNGTDTSCPKDDKTYDESITINNECTVPDADIEKGNDIPNEIAEDNNEMSCDKSVVVNGSINDAKRKLSTEDTLNDKCSKKLKLDEHHACLRPKGVKKRLEGATFWASDFRQKLCNCGVCVEMYNDLSVLFLIDPEDTVTFYENLGMQIIEGAPMSQYEKGLEALSTLDRVQQINAMTEYNKMKDSLIDYLKNIQQRNEIVKEEDIKNFFAGMKPRREPDGVYFCK